jgi:hypothetical protein
MDFDSAPLGCRQIVGRISLPEAPVVRQISSARSASLGIISNTPWWEIVILAAELSNFSRWILGRLAAIIERVWKEERPPRRLRQWPSSTML